MTPSDIRLEVQQLNQLCAAFLLDPHGNRIEAVYIS